MVSMIAEHAEWCGGPPCMIEYAQKRLQDPAFTRSKSWACISAAAFSDGTRAARRLIEGHAADPDSFVRTAVRKVLSFLHHNEQEA